MTQTVTSELSYVRIKRLKDSYTWNVQVAADSGSPEDLCAAKERALVVVGELEARLGAPRLGKLADDDDPFQ